MDLIVNFIEVEILSFVNLELPLPRLLANVAAIKINTSCKASFNFSMVTS